MKILLLAPPRHPLLPGLEPVLKQGLAKAGHQAAWLRPGWPGRLFRRKPAAAQTLAQIRAFAPRLIFCLDGGGLDPAVLAEAQRVTGAKLAAWWLTPEEKPGSSLAVAALCDLFLSGFPLEASLYQSAGSRPPVFFPLGFSAKKYHKRFLSPGEGSKYGSELACLGPLIRENLKTLQVLSGCRLKIWSKRIFSMGKGGPQAKSYRLSSKYPLFPYFTGILPGPAAAAKIFNAAPVIIHLHSPVDPAASLQHDFEITGSGAFLLTDQPEWLSSHLKPEQEFVSFSSPGTLKEKVEYYLKNPTDRAYIALCGFQRTTTEHTWEHRMEQLADKLKRLEG